MPGKRARPVLRGPWCSNAPGLPDTTSSRPKLVVSSDGRGVVSHAGSRLLADLADATGLTGAFSSALRRLRPRGTGHDPGRVAVDLAVMLADGGEAIRDLALLRDQAQVFGAVASTSTAWRVLAATDAPALSALRAARATARETAWMQAAETRAGIPAARAAGRDLPGLVLDLEPPWSPATPRRNRPPRPTSTASATTPCCASSTTPAKHWPASCGPAMPGPTPQPTTSPSWTTPWPRSPTPTATAPKSSSAPTARAAPKPS